MKKIRRQRKKEVSLIYKLADEFNKKTKLQVFLRDECKLFETSFDWMVFDEEMNIQAIIKVVYSKEIKSKTIIFLENSKNYFGIENWSRYQNISKKHNNIPIILCFVNKNNSSKVLNELLYWLRWEILTPTSEKEQFKKLVKELDDCYGVE